MTEHPRAAIAIMPPFVERFFTPEHLADLHQLVRVNPEPITDYAQAGDLSDLEYLITGWGAPLVDEAALELMPRLTHIFHTAGTVKTTAHPAVWKRGITVTSAALANAIPVAEFTLAAILLAGKRVPQAIETYHRTGETAFSNPDAYTWSGSARLGNYRQSIGIISASTIGRLVLNYLRPFDYEIMLYDPFVDDAEAEALGARKVELSELFAESDIVSLHAPDLPATRGMVSRDLLFSMQEGATFINTARPAIVDQDALVDLLREGRHYALLDVTTPEPLPSDHALWTLPNVKITPHWAGSQGNELHRMAKMATAAIADVQAGLPPRGAVSLEMLATMA